MGRPPFEKETRAATYECIMYRKPPYPSWLSDAARSFIDTALHKAGHPAVSSLPLHVLCAHYSAAVVAADTRKAVMNRPWPLQL